MSNVSTAITACRICVSGDIGTIIDLGSQPPANSLRVDLGEKLPAVPLVLCRCKVCGTIQLTETVRPDYLFRNYVWVTGTSQVTIDYSHTFFSRMIERAPKKPIFVLEVASNDGTFLQRFRERGDTVLGVDPARNIAKMAQDQGIDTIAEFFGEAIAKKVQAERGLADVVFARNVIPHVADVNDVVAGMALMLSDSGTGAIEFHRADRILEELHYDSIYHEHLTYLSLHSVGLLLKRHGLKAFDVTDSPISGGSTVVYFSKTERPLTDAFRAMQDHEKRLAIQEEGPWLEFRNRCHAHRDALRGLVDAAKQAGKKLIGYGASARSSTLLNSCGIDHRHLDAVADKNPLKHNRYTPGTDVRILAPREAFALKPDAVLLLGWNFRDEILSEMKNDLQWRGDVIVPLPGDPSTIKLS